MFMLWSSTDRTWPPRTQFDRPHAQALHLPSRDLAVRQAIQDKPVPIAIVFLAMGATTHERPSNTRAQYFATVLPAPKPSALANSRALASIMPASLVMATN